MARFLPRDDSVRPGAVDKCENDVEEINTEKTRCEKGMMAMLVCMVKEMHD